MPLYQQIVVTLPKFNVDGLVTLFRRHSEIILNNGGIVRGIENHGVRPLQERAKRKYATLDGTRFFWEARYVTATFDLSPKALIELDRLLRNDDGVLRWYTTRVKSGFERVNSRCYKNPYITLKNSNIDNTTIN